MSNVLNAAQMRVYRAICELISEKNYAPSIREIGQRCERTSTSTIKAHIDALARLGYITFEPTLPRTIRIKVRPTGDGAAA